MAAVPKPAMVNAQMAYSTGCFEGVVHQVLTWLNITSFRSKGSLYSPFSTREKKRETVLGSLFSKLHLEVVLHGASRNLAAPGCGVPRVDSGTDEARQNTDGGSCDGEGEHGIGFGLSFEILQKLVHDGTPFVGGFIILPVFYARKKYDVISAIIFQNFPPGKNFSLSLKSEDKIWKPVLGAPIS